MKQFLSICLSLMFNFSSYAQNERTERWINTKLVVHAVDLSDSINLQFTRIYVQDSIKDIREIIVRNTSVSSFPAPSSTVRKIKPDLASLLISTLSAQPNTIFFIDRLGFDEEANKVTIIIDWWGIKTSSGEIQWFPHNQLKRSFETYLVVHPLKSGEHLPLSEFISNRFFKGKSIYEENVRSRLPSRK